MEVYVIGSRRDFDEAQIKRLENIGKLFFIEELKEKSLDEYLTSNEEKIIAIDPDLIKWDLPNDIIDKISNLKAICLMSTSYSYVDIDYCNNKSILVTNVPKYSTDSVAEYACYLMMALARRFPLHIKNGFKEDFSTEYMGLQLKSKKAGIIGLGSIGTRLAEILKGLGLDVSYWSKQNKDNRFQYEQLEDLFATSDFVFPTFAINEETKKIISDNLINSMKPTASIISIVGTDCFNKDLVVHKVKNDELYGFAFESGDENMNNYEGNIMITAPYAWYTKEALDNCIEIWVQSIEGAANGTAVNKIKKN